MHRTTGAGGFGAEAQAGAGMVGAFVSQSRTWAWVQRGAREGDARLPRARPRLQVFAVGNISAVPASWDTRLSCPVTAQWHEEPGHSPTGHPAGV